MLGSKALVAGDKGREKDPARNPWGEDGCLGWARILGGDLALECVDPGQGQRLGDSDKVSALSNTSSPGQAGPGPFGKVSHVQVEVGQILAFAPHPRLLCRNSGHLLLHVWGHDSLSSLGT